PCRTPNSSLCPYTPLFRSVAEVAAAGHHVVLATGRSATSATTVARDLGLLRGPAVCSNGAVTVRMDPDLADGYEVVERITFDPGDRKSTRLNSSHVKSSYA